MINDNQGGLRHATFQMPPWYEKLNEIETISQNREELEGKVKNLTKDLDDLKSRESSLKQEIELLNQDNKSLEEELTKIKDELAEERKTRK